MTSEQAIDILKSLHFMVGNEYYNDNVEDAINTAIASLKQKPVDVKNMMWDICMEGVNVEGGYCMVRYKDIKRIVNEYIGGLEGNLEE